MLPITMPTAINFKAEEEAWAESFDQTQDAVQPTMRFVQLRKEGALPIHLSSLVKTAFQQCVKQGAPKKIVDVVRTLPAEDRVLHIMVRAATELLRAGCRRETEEVMAMIPPAQNGETPGVRLRQAEILFLLGRANDAKQFLDTILGGNEQELSKVTQMIHLLIEQKRPDQAQELLRYLQLRYPERFEIRRAEDRLYEKYGANIFPRRSPSKEVALARLLSRGSLAKTHTESVTNGALPSSNGENAQQHYVSHAGLSDDALHRQRMEALTFADIQPFLPLGDEERLTHVHFDTLRRFATIAGRDRGGVLDDFEKLLACLVRNGALHRKYEQELRDLVAGSIEHHHKSHIDMDDGVEYKRAEFYVRARR